MKVLAAIGKQTSINLLDDSNSVMIAHLAPEHSPVSALAALLMRIFRVRSVSGGVIENVTMSPTAVDLRWAVSLIS
jgi:hypothetical protein